ncbi:glucosylglycerol-phosphate synthase [Flavihumibacter stibioxidans]|uniref:Glucosylglycerol-phosphate synthase n=1 Tax=Flavihumibacter stibioxidans TaxID=1834163 RepID=A0ABR7MD59_9BACT|nr:glucosylglycerol-phosphate synthase [Flavihumibacter stibioxidans]MBC6492764.1 glucosylglycerol-phosphate synthase [Flavihumibacter stibioxidans]
MLLLATDLDGTFLGGKSADKQQLYRVIRENPSIRLVFVTGRGLETVIPLLNDPVIPNPDYIICDVGATVVNGRTLEPVQPLQAEIENRWPGALLVGNRLKDIPGLRRQEVPMTRRSSYFFDEETDMDLLNETATELGCDVLVSAGRFVDVLPPGINKGFSLKQLVNLLNIPEDHILVAGDTLNDLSLYKTGYKGVVVGEAESALVEATAGDSLIYQARRAGCGGILEAFKAFGSFNQYDPATEENQVLPATGERQLLMVYHRLPYEIREVNGIREHITPRSPNGIIPSLMGFFSQGRSGTWIAWEEVDKPGKSLRNIYIDEKQYPHLLAGRIGLTKKEVELFYKVFSKEAFWPTIFSFVDKASFNHDHWDHYVRINRIFAEKTAAEADLGANVWIHDYNLWMVPGILRQLRPDLNIAFFHHTSFPPADIFNIIPWRGDIIGSLLQCDYIGFHIPRYAENFVDVVKSILPATVLEEQNCTERFLSYSCPLGVEKMPRLIEAGSRQVRLGAHPIGVHTAYIKELYEKETTTELVKKLRNQLGKDKKIVLSVERLDYVKGPLEKIYAFQEFLEQYPEFHGKVELINICTPPAKGMKIYDKVQQELEQAIGKINGRYSTIGWTPIHFFFRSFPFEELVAYYAVSDIAWITPLRDGLNLVAKEFVAVQGLKEQHKGVLVISEFAGVSVEMGYALRTNPYDKKSLREVLLQALLMEEQERDMRMGRLFDSVQYYDIAQWSESFMQEMEAITPLQFHS